MYTCAIVGYMYIHELNYQHTHRSFEHGFVLTRTLFFSKSYIPYRKYTIPGKSYQRCSIVYPNACTVYWQVSLQVDQRWFYIPFLAKFQLKLI